MVESRIILGDCVKVMAALPADSVDAIVTDPPYGLGFMGKQWDSLPPGPEWAAECLRVLKPGGHLLAFGGTRTWHRLAVAVEDAGFEIRDSIAWMYGCLTDDAEILTDTGWKPGTEVKEGDLVAQWDHETGHITLAPVEQTYRAPWNGEMRVLRNSDTDQVLTPNHRVYHRTMKRKIIDGYRAAWYEDQWEVAEADDVTRHQPTRLPVAGVHDGPGIGGDAYAALLGWVWTEGSFDRSGTGVRITQSSVNGDKVAEIDALVESLTAHKRYDRTRTYKGRDYVETTWFFSGDFARRVRGDLPGKRPTYNLLWSMTADEKRALYRAAMLGDGSGWGGKSPQFHQRWESDLVWLQTLLALINMAGKVGMRKDRDNGSLYVRNRATTELQHKHLKDDREHYSGEVWCVKVPTGAFVARRNGGVFITGNSGFPKSLDVSKAIDKDNGRKFEDRFALGRHIRERREALGLTTAEVNGWFGYRDGCQHWERQDRSGARVPTLADWRILRERLGLSDEYLPLVERVEAEREVIGTKTAGIAVPGEKGRYTVGGSRSVVVDVTAANSDAARQWSGWGTALKPAFEPVVVARKPLGAGTVAANVLQHGTGALNIDGCRIETDDNLNGGGYSATPNSGAFLLGGCQSRAELERLAAAGGKTPNGENATTVLARADRPVADRVGEYVQPSGRWPANVILDESQAAALDEQSGHGDSGGASRFFYVARKDDECPSGPYSSTASTADSPSNGDDPAPGSVPADAPTLAHHDTGRQTVSPSMNGTPNESRPNGGRSTQQTPTTGAESSPAPPPARPTLTRNPANSAEPVEPTDTTTTTPDRWTSDGSAANATSNGTHAEKALGELDSRFSYVAKAPKKERPVVDGVAHPTVKPLALMRWLVRLVTPPGGTVLEPFAGSGTTVEAALLEGVNVIAIEREAEYLPLIQARIDRVQAAEPDGQPTLI